MLSKTGLRSFRILVGISALVAGFSVPYITSNGALDWSVLVFGGLVLLHIGVDMVWDLLSGTNAGANPGDASSGQVYTITAVPGEPKPNVTAPTSPSAAAGEKSPTDATVQLVIALITTAGCCARRYSRLHCVCGFSRQSLRGVPRRGRDDGLCPVWAGCRQGPTSDRSSLALQRLCLQPDSVGDLVWHAMRRFLIRV